VGLGHQQDHACQQQADPETGHMLFLPAAGRSQQ
jgi:hypothetical protein